MPRRPNLIPPVQLNVALPLDIHTQLTSYLYSELEGRVPHGAYSRFLIDLLKTHFAGKELELSPYIPNAAPGAFIVKGPADAILALKYRLEAANHV